MVIAIMGGTFSRVENDKDAYIYRSKLGLVIDNLHRFSADTMGQLTKFKYVLAIDVDPEVDPIEQDTIEKRMK